MKLLAIDPSSKAVGYAIFDRSAVIKYGVLKSPKKDYWDRIVVTAEQMLHVASITAADVIVVEVSSLGVAQKLAGRGRGLAHYGEAVGAICGWLVAWGYRINRVPSSVWTRSYRCPGNTRKQASKKERQQLMEIEHKYKPKGDSGADAADAIALGAWWLREERSKA